MANTWHETPTPPTLHEVLASKLLHAVTQRDEAQRRVDALARSARASGMSWESIGAALGMTKQGAQQRYLGGGAA